MKIMGENWNHKPQNHPVFGFSKLLYCNAWNAEKWFFKTVTVTLMVWTLTCAYDVADSFEDDIDLSPWHWIYGIIYMQKRAGSPMTFMIQGNVLRILWYLAFQKQYCNCNATFLRFTEKCRFRLFSLQHRTSYPWSYHRFKPNKRIVLHLSALYSAIYNNHQYLYSKIRLCNVLIHREM